jgi:hypothetical protein
VTTIGSAALVLALLLTGDAEVADGSKSGVRFGFDAWRCGQSVRSSWRQRDGRVVAEEKLDLEGERWVRYQLRRHNLAQDVVAVRAEGEVTLTIRNGEALRRVTLKAGDGLLAGPTLVSHVATALPRLQQGQPLEFDYLIAEQGMVLRLRASADPDRAGSRLAAGSVAGDTVVHIEAASMLLRPFVPATTLVFDAAGGLRSMTGRLLPQAGDITKPKSLDGVLRIRPVQVAGLEPRMQSGMQSGCNNPDLS